MKRLVITTSLIVLLGWWLSASQTTPQNSTSITNQASSKQPKGTSNKSQIKKTYSDVQQNKSNSLNAHDAPVNDVETDLTLAQKQAQEQESERQLNKKIARIRQSAATTQNSSKQISPEFAQNMLDIFKMSAKGDWEKLLSSTSEAELVDSQILDIALMQAITHNSPINVISTLISRGAQFTPETMSVLAIRNNLKLTKQLIPLGLNIHAVDSLGKNALFHTFTSFQSQAMFDFLLMNNVAVSSPAQGLDLLDLALQRTATSMDGVYYVRRLIEFNAPISTSHRELLQIVKSQNPEAYQQIEALF